MQLERLTSTTAGRKRNSQCGSTPSADPVKSRLLGPRSRELLRHEAAWNPVGGLDATGWSAVNWELGADGHRTRRESEGLRGENQKDPQRSRRRYDLGLLFPRTGERSRSDNESSGGDASLFTPSTTTLRTTWKEAMAPCSGRWSSRHRGMARLKLRARSSESKWGTSRYGCFHDPRPTAQSDW
jgi:hypothetical protein